MHGPEHASARVAIVAHEASTLARHAAALAEQGVPIALAQNERELLSGATPDWDVVLIELASVDDSMRVARLLAEQATEMATVVVGDLGDDAMIEVAFQAGIFDWLPATCPLPLLMAAIRRARDWRTLRRDEAPAATADTLPPDVVHTINNQIAGLVGLIQLHVDDAALSAELHADLQLMQQSALGIAALLRQYDRR